MLALALAFTLLIKSLKSSIVKISKFNNLKVAVPSKKRERVEVTTYVSTRLLP